MFTFLRKLRRAFQIYDDALAEAHADAKAKAGPMIERMTAEAVTEAKAKLAKALSDAEVAAEDAERKAMQEGYIKGKEKGKKDGYAEGQEKAYYAVAATHLPALFNEGFSIKDLEILVGDFDQAGRYTQTNWPNIYDTGDSYCVRVICEGRRHVQWFIYKAESKWRPGRLGPPRRIFIPDIKSKIKALADAAIWLSKFVNISETQYLTLLSDCTANLTPTTDGFSTQEMIYVCASVHRKIRKYGGEMGTLGWVGDSPTEYFTEGWAQISQPLFWRPWSSLFTKVPESVDSAFEELGLGRQGEDGERTVRDLLMLTQGDLIDVNGIGQVRLEKLVARLHENHLHFWGDDIARAEIQDENNTFNGRAFRAIDLE